MSNFQGAASCNLGNDGAAKKFEIYIKFGYNISIIKVKKKNKIIGSQPIARMEKENDRKRSNASNCRR